MSENLFKPEEPLDIIIQHGEVLSNVFKYVVENNTSNNAPYHNLHHMLRVMTFCNEGCKYHKLDGRLRTNLLVAALFHDYNHSMGEKKDDENVKNAITGFTEWYDSVSSEFRNSINFDKIVQIIQATEYPYVIRIDNLGLEQRIIRDADLMVALESDWLNNIIVGLATEMKRTDYSAMIEGNIKFHEDIRMTSVWGQKIRESLWGDVFSNLLRFKRLLEK